MSYIELFGTIFTGWSVYLAAKNKIISWPIGIVGVVLYMFLFFQIQLYADLIEQIYYLVTGFYGWWLWSHPKNTEEKDGKNELRISENSRTETIVSWLVIILGTVLLGNFISNIDSIFPAFFTEPASYPYLDTFTTVLSFVANYLLMKRKLDCWYMWIIVDVIGVWLYYVKGTPLLSILYFAFLINAVVGQIKWRKTLNAYQTI
jgi:nicotinamide mononucleotide transporter